MKKEKVKETHKREISEKESAIFANHVRTGMYENTYIHDNTPGKEAYKEKYPKERVACAPTACTEVCTNIYIYI